MLGSVRGARREPRPYRDCSMRRVGLASNRGEAHIATMPYPSHRIVALLSATAAAAALGVAYATEYWGGLVPCALCLAARWPYWIAIALGLLAALAPAWIGRPLLMLLVVALLADVAVSAVHVGVEFAWWPSPLPECAAPNFGGGSIAERLAAMPARPAKPCDEPTFLVPFLPISMAGLNLLFGLGCAASLIWFLSRRTPPRMTPSSP